MEIKMDPADLLYADARRIDSYFSQIGGHKRQIKVAGKLTLSWSPSIKISTKEQDSKASIFYKIDAIKKHLDKRNLMRFGRPLESDLDVDFVEEICSVTMIKIPARPKAADPTKKIILLVSKPEPTTEQSGILVLVQDFNYPDERATSFYGTSTFSVLSALVYNTRKEIDESILNARLMHEPHPTPDAKFGTEHHPWSLSEFHTVRNHIYDFAVDPVDLLKSWNCEVGWQRRVSVVYKVREWGRDAAHGWQKTTVFGYPIWIFASP
jgi:hypothetical protein